MTARVIATAGPARTGKTSRVLALYREALAERVPGSTLWLAPTWRAAAATRDRVMDGIRDGCLSPAVMTFDHFAEAVLKASREPVRPLSRSAKRQLVRLLLDEHLQAGRIRHFLPIARTGGLVELVCELISELKRLDIWPDRFRDACRSRGMTAKDAELWAIYEAYQQVLNEHHLYDAEGRFWSARRLLRDGCRAPFERLRLVVVDGFTDFTPPQHEILQILGEWVAELRITLSLDEEPRRGGLFHKPARTLEELCRRHARLVVERAARPAESDWPAMAHLEAHLFANPRQMRPASDTGGVEILAASRQLGEIELIGSRIKRMLTTGTAATGGRPARPGDVAVVFRSLDDVEGLVRETFGKLGIPFVLESGQPLDRSMALAALVGLVRLDVEDWPFRGLLAVLSNTYFRPTWPEWQDGLAVVAAERAIRRLQIPRGRTSLLEQLEREGDRSTGTNGTEWHSALQGSSTGTNESGAPGANQPPEGAADAAEERQREAQLAWALLVRLARALDALPERATLGQWADAWRGLGGKTGLLGTIEDDERSSEEELPAAPPPSLSSTRFDRIAWETLRNTLHASDRLARSVRRAPPELDRSEALAALVDTLGSVRVRPSLDESGRVRVLSAASARALRIPYLFFAGLAERSFPPPDGHDRLYSDAEQRALIEGGLPLAARTDRSFEEMLVFYEVMTRASRRLFFSYPALDEAAQPLSASPYLEEVDQACGPGRILRTEVRDLRPIPAHDEPLSVAEFRVKAVSAGLEGDVSLLAGLVQSEPRAGLAEAVLAGLRMVEARGDRTRFGPAEGILAGRAAQREMATRFGPAWTFTATELEQYASCPYQFFLERVLGIEPLEDLDLTVDYRARGRLAHVGLADFHQRVNEHGGGPTSPATLAPPDYQRLLDQTRQRLTEHVTPTPLDAALHEVDLRLWTRWANDYRQQHQDYDAYWKDCEVPPRPTWFEASFGHARRRTGPRSTERPLELAAPEGAIRIAGRIDRIDTGVVAGGAVFNVIDYKTGTSSRYTPADLAAGTALQLPLYAMAAQEVLLADVQAVPLRAGYWLLQRNGFQPKRALEMYARRDDRLAPRPEWEELRRGVVAMVAKIVEEIRGGRFRVTSADAQCTRFCPFRTVCRIGQVRSLEKTWQPTSHEG
jgi:ATP-dependent helicase/DNAse subunit B